MNASVSMWGFTQHISYHLLNKHLHVGYLFDAIKSEDAGLQAAMVNVEEYTGIGRKRENFERESDHLLPKDPSIKKKNTATKRSSADICDSVMIQTKKVNGIKRKRSTHHVT